MNKLEKANTAYDTLKEIHKLAEQVKVNFVALIERLKYVRDNDLALALGYESFADFIRNEEPAIGFKYNTVRAYIHLYELYTEIDRLGELEYLGWGRAQVIAPHVKSDPDEWIAKAETLSSKDLINDVRVASGKQEMQVLPPPESPSPMSSSYREYCKARGCCLCGKKAEMHHFPHGRNNTDNLDKQIPLCPDCHTQGEDAFHRTPWGEWMGKYGRVVCDFLMDYILRREE